MHLVSKRKQTIKLADESYAFEQGETIHTENSYKYTTAKFQQLAQRAGWHPRMVWRDRQGLFDVHYLSLNADELHQLPQQIAAS